MYLKTASGPKFHVLEHRPEFISKLGKSRVYLPIKNMFLKDLDHFRRGMDPDGLGQCRKQIVDKQWKPRNVVQVSMADNNIAGRRLLIYRACHRKVVRCCRLDAAPPLSDVLGTY